MDPTSFQGILISNTALLQCEVSARQGQGLCLPACRSVVCRTDKVLMFADYTLYRVEYGEKCDKFSYLCHHIMHSGLLIPCPFENNKERIHGVLHYAVSSLVYKSALNFVAEFFIIFFFFLQIIIQLHALKCMTVSMRRGICPRVEQLQWLNHVYAYRLTYIHTSMCSLLFAKL